MSFVNKRLRLALGLWLLMAALLVACGDSTPTTSVAPTSATTATTVAATTAATAATTAAMTSAASATTVAATTAATTTAAATTVAATTASVATTASASGTSTAKQFNGGKPYTLTIWTIGLKGNKKFEDYLNGVYAAYKQTHSNVTINWEDYGADIDQKLLTAIASGTVPDVVNFNTSYALRLASNGALTDISTVITPEQKGQYFDTLYASTTVGNAQYGVPWYASLQVAMINKDLFAKAGLDPANPPKTYADLANDAKAFHDKTEAYAFQPITQLEGESLLEGFPMLSPDKTKAAFNTPDALAKLTYYDNLKKGDLIPSKSPFDDKAYDDALARYKSGKLGILLTGASLLSQVETDAPDIFKNTIVAPAPVGKSGLIPVDMQNLTIPKGVKDPAAALDLATFVTNDQNQLAFDHLATILPSTKIAAQDPFFQQPGDVKQDARRISANSLKNAKDATVSIANYDKLSTILKDNLNQWWAGSKTPQQALDDASKAWNDVLATNK